MKKRMCAVYIIIAFMFMLMFSGFNNVTAIASTYDNDLFFYFYYGSVNVVSGSSQSFTAYDLYPTLLLMLEILKLSELIHPTCHLYRRRLIMAY